MSYLPSREASRILKLHPNTLRRLADIGKIDHIRTASGQRHYNVQDYITKHKLNIQTKSKVCYCRVSSNKQKNDLERQIKFMQEQYPTYEIISDIGSSLNYKRKGLQSLLERINKGEIAEVVVAYKDRLSRFSFELIEQFVKLNHGKIVVLNKDCISQEQELAEDLISIITIFSARIHGSRKYKTRKKTETDYNSRTEDNSEEMVWSSEDIIQSNINRNEKVSPETD